MNIDYLQDIILITFFAILANFITPLILSLNSFQQVRNQRLVMNRWERNCPPLLTQHMRHKMLKIKDKGAFSFGAFIQTIRNYFVNPRVRKYQKLEKICNSLIDKYWWIEDISHWYSVGGYDFDEYETTIHLTIIVVSTSIQTMTNRNNSKKSFVP